MYDTYGQSVKSPEIIWNYLAYPISDAPVLITETSTIGEVTGMHAIVLNNTNKSFPHNSSPYKFIG